VNPVPLPALSALAQKTPAGQTYQGLLKTEQARLLTNQEALSGVAMTSAPMYPLGTWAATAMQNVTAGQPTAVQQAVSTKVARGTQSSASASLAERLWTRTKALASAAVNTITGSGAACNPNSWKKNVHGAALQKDLASAAAAAGVPVSYLAANMTQESGGGNCAAAPGLPNGYCGQNANSTARGPMQVENIAAQQACIEATNAKSSQAAGLCQGKNPNNPAQLSQITSSMNPQLNTQQAAWYGKSVLQTVKANGLHPPAQAFAEGYNMGTGYLTGGTVNGKPIACVQKSGCVYDQSYVNGFSANLTCPGATQSGTGNNASLAKSVANGYNPLSPTAGGARISENMFLYILDQQRFANPKWWKHIETATSVTYLQQQDAEIQVIMTHIHRLDLVSEERIAAIIAQQGGVYNTTAALSVRNSAIASSMQ
jgi:hypothetical protein